MRHAWEDEGDQVLQLNRLLPLTFPSHAATGPFLSPPGRGKTKHTSRPERQHINAAFEQVPQAFGDAAPASQVPGVQICDAPKNIP